MGINVQLIKNDFPIFNNSNLNYLDNAATTQKPASVLDAIQSMYSEANANVHRAIYDLGNKATDRYEKSRATIANFIGADSEKEVVFTSGTTESINLLSRCLGSKLKPGDEILITEMEHHSNIVPWQQIAKQTGASLNFIPISKTGELSIDRPKNYFNSATKIVSVTHISNVLGTINPIKKLVKLAHEQGAILIVDGAQAVPHQKINVKDLGCDFYVFSGHKMLGPTGIGILWGKLDKLKEMEPFMGGGEMIQTVTMSASTWNDVPYKFEAGTPNFVQAVGLGAAVDYLTGIGMEKIHHHEMSLTSYALDKLEKIQGLNVHGSSALRSGVISFNIEGIHSNDLAYFLNEFNIAVRVGHHCAQPLLSKLGETATARISLYLYNDESDIDNFCNALNEIKSYF